MLIWKIWHNQFKLYHPTSIAPKQKGLFSNNNVSDHTSFYIFKSRQMLTSRFPNPYQSNKNLERLYIRGVGCFLLFVFMPWPGMFKSWLWLCCRDGWNVTKIGCHTNWKITKTKMSQKTEMSPKLKCQHHWNVNIAEMFF